MDTKLYIILLIICVINGIHGQDKTHYIGAVVDFASKSNKTLTPINEIIANLKEYNDFISKAAKENADIIVFPECGLTSLDLPTTQSELLSYASVIPNPAREIRNPCNDSGNVENNDWAFQISNLSCAAKANNIYIVVNLPERYVSGNSREDGDDLIYNTNIVFDRKGDLIARYRKFNLFGEPGFNSTEKSELITFKTDFGVTFGTFICFDILFTNPPLELLAKFQDVTDIVYPTAWFSELPFLTAVQTQAGWAKANGVNLLSAGYNNPAKQSGGSGIFTVDGNLKYIMPSKHESTLIVSQIPITKKRKTSVITQHQPIKTEISEVMKARIENLTIYTTELVNKSLSDHKLCHNEFCCVFDLTFNHIENADYYYRMVVYEGARLMGVREQNIQVCGVAACTDKTFESCGNTITQPKNSIIFDSISVKGDMFIEKSTFFPSFTDYSLGTFSHYYYNATVGDKFKQIEMKNLVPVKNLLGFGIYGTTESSAFFVSANWSFIFGAFVACFILKKFNI